MVDINPPQSRQPLLPQPNAISRKPLPDQAHPPVWHELRSAVDPTNYDIPQGHKTTSNGPLTVREYDRSRQRKKLLLSCVLQLLITLLLCIAAAMVLLGYSRPSYLSSNGVRGFNALITIFQIGISINIASSLRSYAKMLRWRILASSYRSLKEFDLILSCSEQTSILKLLWHTRRLQHWYIPSLSQIICLVWLSINLASVVVVALIGLTYSMGASTAGTATYAGDISVLDMSNEAWIQTSNFLTTALGVAYTTNFPINGTAKARPCEIFSCDEPACPETWAYGFQDKIAVPYTDIGPNFHKQGSPVWGPSGRSVKASASCQQVTISSDPTSGDSTLEFLFGDGYISLDLENQFVPDSMTYIWDTKTVCGNTDEERRRCSVVYAYRRAGPQLSDSELYLCSNTISQISGSSVDIASSEPEYAEVFDLKDTTARSLAGSIGNALVSSPDGQYTYALYAQYNPWAMPDSQPGGIEIGIAGLISSFPMAALAAIDQEIWLPFRRNVPGQVPYIPPHLSVSWTPSLTLLAIIPFLQLLSLFAVVLWANKAIVKNDSNLSIAKLLTPVVERLGDRGCLLSGDEMVEVLGRSGMRVAYNFDVRRREGRDDGRDIMHVGLFEKKTGFTIEKTFPEGWYDGLNNQE